MRSKNSLKKQVKYLRGRCMHQWQTINDLRAQINANRVEVKSGWLDTMLTMSETIKEQQKLIDKLLTK